jgi:hypothetical protein
VQAFDEVGNAAGGALVTIGSSAKARSALASNPAAKAVHTIRTAISLSNIFFSPRVLKQHQANWNFSWRICQSSGEVSNRALPCRI